MSSKLLATGFAIYAAANYGTHVGYAYLEQTNPQSAQLYGCAATFAATWLAVKFILDRMQHDVQFALLFAGLAAYGYGIQVGYRFYGMTDDIGAAIYGYPTVFLLAMIVAQVVLWPIVRGIGNGVFGSIKRGQLGIAGLFRRTPKLTYEQIEARVVRGDDFQYRGLVDRDFWWHDGNRRRKARIRVDFQLKRNTRTMSDREQLAVVIYRVLDKHRLLGRAADHLRFALAWGDGKAQVYGGKFTTDARVLQQNGIAGGFRALIANEANERNASIEGAFGELYTRLQNAAASRHVPEDVAELYARHGR